MNTTAISKNNRGIELEEAGQSSAAEAMYREAIQAAPAWSVPWFNLGLLYKRAARWSEALRCSRRAVELDPDDEGGWWNLGIAATAVGEWAAAREAWRACGLPIPPGEGPIELDFGLVPIRVNPTTGGEVLWCLRIDPARAIVRSVPLPESRHRFGDLLLHDGEPKGFRMVQGREVPVFDELAILQRSSYSTFETVIEEVTPAALETLLGMADDQELGSEDWSTIRRLCKECSEGRPHQQHRWEQQQLPPRARRLGFAAADRQQLASLLAQWRIQFPSARLSELHCALEAGERSPDPQQSGLA